MAAIGIDIRNVQPNAGFSALDKGKHTVIIYKSDFKPTANGAGKKLEMHFKVNGGVLNGREAMLNFNWENSSEMAVKIGQGQFRTICDAVGVFPQDTQQLHNIPFVLEVDVTPDGKYNEFVNAFPIAQGQPQNVAQFVQPVQQPVYQQPMQQAPVQQFAPVQAQPVYQQPAQAQPQQQYVAPQGQANPMAQYEAMAKPVQQFAAQPIQQAQPVMQPQGQPEVPDWIKNQMAAQGQQPAPMGNV